MRILVIDDHRDTRDMVAQLLERDGHEVVLASTCREGRVALLAGSHDLALIDWMLPDGSGTDLVRAARDAGLNVPILVLTARGDIEDRVEGLDAGADDYLRKPFAVAELEARVRALLRRGPRPREPITVLGSLTIHGLQRRIEVDGREILLTAREYALLTALARNAGRPMSRADILTAAWGEESASGAASLEVLIARLRRKLGPIAGRLLQTHRSFGYSLEEPR